MSKQNKKLIENIKKLDKMMYYCKCGNTQHIPKATIIYIESKGWVTKEAKCHKCPEYMESKPTEGMPGIIRTEPTLTKK